MKVSVEVINRQRKIIVSSRRVINLVKKILKFLYEVKNKNLFKLTGENSTMLSVSVIFVGERKMKELNFRYRGKKINH